MNNDEIGADDVKKTDFLKNYVDDAGTTSESNSSSDKNLCVVRGKFDLKSGKIIVK